MDHQVKRALVVLGVGIAFALLALQLNQGGCQESPVAPTKQASSRLTPTDIVGGREPDPGGAGRSANAEHGQRGRTERRAGTLAPPLPAPPTAAPAPTPLPDVPMPPEWGDLAELGRVVMPPHGLRRVFIGDEDTIELSALGVEVRDAGDGVLMVFGVEEGTTWLRVGEAGAIEFRVDPTAPLPPEADLDEPAGEPSVGDPVDQGARIPIYLAVGEEVVIHLLGVTNVGLSAPDVVELTVGAVPDTLVIRGLAPGLVVVQMDEESHDVWVHEE